MAEASSPNQSAPLNPPPLQNETALVAQQDTGNVIATSALDTLKGPAPSLEAYANFNSSSPPTLLRSERRQAGKHEYVTSCSKLEEILQQALGLSASIPVPPATIISGLREMHEQCQKRKQDVSEGKAIPPEDLIDLTNEANDENDMEKWTRGSSAPKPSPKRRCMENNKLSDEPNFSIQLPTKPSDASPPLGESNQQDLVARKEEVHLPIGHTPPPKTQDTVGVPPNPAGLSTSASLTLTAPEATGTWLSVISASQGADPATSMPSSTGPEIPINPATPTSTSQLTAIPSEKQPGSNSAGPVGGPNQPGPASSEDPNTDAAAPAAPNPNPSIPHPPPITPSLILDETTRAGVHAILSTFQGNLNRHKFKQAHLAIHVFVDCQAKSMHKRTPPPKLPQFALIQSRSTHAAWLKDIQKYLDTILLPSHDEPWNCPRLIDMSNLKFQPCRVKNTRPCRIPPRPLTAQDLAVRPSSLGDLNQNNLDSHLRILEYLNSCKTSGSASNSEDRKLRNDMTLKPLYQLHDLIIDIFITYSIIRGSAVADVELDATSAESQALVVQKKELDKHCSRHNYTPFCLYLVAGVRGLIMSPNNRQFASGHRL
ncbi:hypothetical protein PSTG_12100 [Puccinia striiformis f. sp. tritici PST-78]|uniref:Uncharacterized protein n=1 Tax=Puccinia striiformis f. sp. tritici PST-78 TaxID=1165861 RepID=A0A0L0V6E1_9BASI|nr:hypothetical protein PSTG_12100 [Puccinia striiformis f. sp. tritici PST-78]